MTRGPDKKDRKKRERKVKPIKLPPVFDMATSWAGKRWRKLAADVVGIVKVTTDSKGHVHIDRTPVNDALRSKDANFTSDSLIQVVGKGTGKQKPIEQEFMPKYSPPDGYGKQRYATDRKGNPILGADGRPILNDWSIPEHWAHPQYLKEQERIELYKYQQSQKPKEPVHDSAETLRLLERATKREEKRHPAAVPDVQASIVEDAWRTIRSMFAYANGKLLQRKKISAAALRELDDKATKAILTVAPGIDVGLAYTLLGVAPPEPPKPPKSAARKLELAQAEFDKQRAKPECLGTEPDQTDTIGARIARVENGGAVFLFTSCKHDPCSCSKALQTLSEVRESAAPMDEVDAEDADEGVDIALKPKHEKIGDGEEPTGYTEGSDE